MQDMHFDHTIVIAGLSVDGISGLDFLRLNKCAVDVENCTPNFGQVKQLIDNTEVKLVALK